VSPEGEACLAPTHINLHLTGKLNPDRLPHGLKQSHHNKKARRLYVASGLVIVG